MKGEVFCLSLVGGKKNNLQVNKSQDNTENKNLKKKKAVNFIFSMLNGTQRLITQFLPHNNNQSKPYRYSGYKIIQRSLRRRKQIRGFLSLKNIKYRIINRVLLLSGGLYEILLIIRCTTETIPKAALEKSSQLCIINLEINTTERKLADANYSSS